MGCYSGSHILYLITEETQPPTREVDEDLAFVPQSRYRGGLCRFYGESQAGQTLSEYARGIYRTFLKRDC